MSPARREWLRRMAATTWPRVSRAEATTYMRSLGDAIRATTEARKSLRAVQSRFRRDTNEWLNLVAARDALDAALLRQRRRMTMARVAAYGVQP